MEYFDVQAIIVHTLLKRGNHLPVGIPSSSLWVSIKADTGRATVSECNRLGTISERARSVSVVEEC